MVAGGVCNERTPRIAWSYVKLVFGVTVLCVLSAIAYRIINMLASDIES